MTVHTGSARVTPGQYVEAVAAVAPDVWVALSDDVPSDSRWGTGRGCLLGGWMRVAVAGVWCARDGAVVGLRNGLA